MFFSPGCFSRCFFVSLFCPSFFPAMMDKNLSGTPSETRSWGEILTKNPVTLSRARVTRADERDQTRGVRVSDNIYIFCIYNEVSWKPLTKKTLLLLLLLLLSFRKPDMPHRFAFHRARRGAALVPVSSGTRNHRRGDKSRFESDRFWNRRYRRRRLYGRVVSVVLGVRERRRAVL